MGEGGGVRCVLQVKGGHTWEGGGQMCIAAKSGHTREGGGEGGRCVLQLKVATRGKGWGRGGGGRCVLQIKGGLMREVGITDKHIIHTLKLIPWPSSPVLVTIAYHVENHGKVQKLTFSTSPFSLNLHAFSCDKEGSQPTVDHTCKGIH